MTNATQCHPLLQWFLFEGKTRQGITWSAGLAIQAVMETGALNQDGKHARSARDNGAGFDMRSARSKVSGTFQRARTEPKPAKRPVIVDVERIAGKAALFLFTLEPDNTPNEPDQSR